MNIGPVVPVATVVSQDELGARYAWALEKTKAQCAAMADSATQIAALDNSGEV
ncbi:hypothetical protein D3C80_1786800 [compost metagenome]